MYLRRSSPTNFPRMGPPLGNLACLAGTRQDGVRTTGRKIHTSPFDDESARCNASNQSAPRNAFFRSMPPYTTISTSSVIWFHEGPTDCSASRQLRRGTMSPCRHSRPPPVRHVLLLINVTKPFGVFLGSAGESFALPKCPALESRNGSNSAASVMLS